MQPIAFLFANSVKLQQFKANVSEIKPYLLCLRNISNNFETDKLKKIGLNAKFLNLTIRYETFNASDIENIHK